MLIQLHVKNLALIEEIEVDFHSGLNILTGETGAGKSILLGSMQFILGGKMSKEMIREHASYALIELLFQVENPKVKTELKEMDIELEEDQILLSRKLTDTRSICKINGETCTISQMKKVASYLLDIHGQHEHQSLLYKDKQLTILDEFGKEEIESIREDVKKIYHIYREKEDELSSMSMDEEQRKREIAFLEFEIQEIEEAKLKKEEEVELEQLFRKMSNGRKITETVGKIAAMTGYDTSQSAGETIGQSLRELSKIVAYDDELLPLESSLTDIDSLLMDFNREMNAYIDNLVFDEETFYETEQRLNLIHNLKAKYGKTIEEILLYQKKQEQQLQDLLCYEEHLERVTNELEVIKEKLELKSNILSEKRKKYSMILQQKVIDALKDLNFLDVKFQIHFEKKSQVTENGWDDIEYQISTNPGEPLRALSKVVSGGELSRIMLAIKAILADKDEVETLIFDEIDTGISGRTAQKVSEKMAWIGEHRQVLCITHLPQIAAMADVHYEIRKSVEGEETITRIYALNEESSIRELARLLSGAEVTKTVEENAREMKELAHQYKNARLKKKI